MVGNLFYFKYQYAELWLFIYYINNKFLWKGVQTALMNTKGNWILPA